MTTITIHTNKEYADKIYKKLKADKNLLKVSVSKKRVKKKKSYSDIDRQSLTEFGLQSLSFAYSNDEPDYTDVQVKEPKRKYKKDAGRRHSKN
ncbi:MAG: hypothetical protein ABIT08_04950 [Bacteroidia bacterium]